MNAMAKTYNFQKKCPTLFDFETYLKNTGSPDFNEEFKLHLIECEFCMESVTGYQTAGITSITELLKPSSKAIMSNVQKSSNYKIKIFSYAASLVLLIGLSVFYITQQNNALNNNEANYYDYDLIIEKQPTKNKKLVKKTNDQFIYINSCDKIAFNDQFLSANDLNEKLKEIQHINLIRIEVSTDDYECATKIINTIKRENIAPIITISSSGKIKKLTSRGGALGG